MAGRRQRIDESVRRTCFHAATGKLPAANMPGGTSSARHACIEWSIIR
jgi:hypothetical protein